MKMQTRTFTFNTVNGRVDVELAYTPIDLTPLTQGLEGLAIADRKLRVRIEAEAVAKVEELLDRELLFNSLVETDTW